MKTFYSDKTPLIILRVLLFILCAVPIVVSVTVFPRLPVVVWSAVFVFVTLFMWIGFLYLPCYFARLRVFLSPAEVIVVSGAVNSTRKLMRMGAVQYFTLVKTPFSHTTGLNFVILHGLGGRMLLPCLSFADAEEILLLLNGYRKERAS